MLERPCGRRNNIELITMEKRNNPLSNISFNIPKAITEVMENDLGCKNDGYSKTGLRWIKEEKPIVFFEKIENSNFSLYILPSIINKRWRNEDNLRNVLISSGYERYIANIHTVSTKQRIELRIVNIRWDDAIFMLPPIVNWSFFSQNEFSKISSEYIEKADEIIKNNMRLSIPEGSIHPKNIKQQIRVFQRDPNVRAFVINRANGKCELCNQLAAFIDINDNPYFEVHHIIQLSQGGSDTIANTVCVCPNCHKELHYGKEKAEKTKLLINKCVI